MAVRSVIDIDINDDRFKDFLSLFGKYKAGIVEANEGLAESEVHHSAAALALAEAARLAGRRDDAERRAAREREAEAKAAAREEQRRYDEAKKHLDQMAKTTKDIAKTLLGATKNLLKWGAIGLGVAGIGSLFGLEKLAASVGDARRSAQGLGITSGQQQAFGINFGRYLDPNSNLGAIAEAKANYADRWAFSAMGVNPTGKDPAALAVEMALKAKEVFDRGDRSQQYAQAHGLLQFYTMDELRRLHATSLADLRASATGYGRDARALALSDPHQKRWQDFDIQMQRAGQTLKNVFIDGLTPLAGPLEHLSKEVVEAIEAFMKPKVLGPLIDELGSGIKGFADYVATPKFQTDIRAFVEGIGQVSQAVVDALRFLHVIPQDNSPGATPAGVKAAAAGYHPVGMLGMLDVHKRERATYDYFRSRGWNNAWASAFTANLEQESGLSRNPVGWNDGGKAFGVAQWHADRQLAFKAWAHKDIRESTYAEQLAFVDFEARQRMKAQIAQYGNTTDARLAGGLVSQYYEGPKAVEYEKQARGQMAREISINVNNNTGGNANVQANLAAAR